MQVDAHRANVALTRALRVPDVRAAASGVLGGTFAGRAARDRIAGRNACAKHLGNNNSIEYPMFVTVAPAVRVLLNLIPSIIP